LSTGVSYQTGFFLEYLLGTVIHWRTVAIVNAVFPIVTVIYFSQVGDLHCDFILRISE
jgi:hypothetical protein